MKTLNLEQMEDVQGGGAVGCLAGSVLAVACFVGGCASGVGAAAAAWAITGLYGSILVGCTL